MTSTARYHCECGSVFENTQKKISKHLLTRKHISYLNTQDRKKQPKYDEKQTDTVECACGSTIRNTTSSKAAHRATKKHRDMFPPPRSDYSKYKSPPPSPPPPPPPKPSDNKKWFDGVNKTKLDITNRFRYLVLIHHPDKGGLKENFVAIFSEYKTLLAQVN
jgi:hypothetical protein